MARMIDETRIEGEDEFRVVPTTNSQYPVYLERNLESHLPPEIEVDLTGFYPFVQLQVRSGVPSSAYY